MRCRPGWSGWPPPGTGDDFPLKFTATRAALRAADAVVAVASRDLTAPALDSDQKEALSGRSEGSVFTPVAPMT